MLHPDAAPVHKQHLEADDDTDFICPGEISTSVFVLQAALMHLTVCVLREKMSPVQTSGCTFISRCSAAGAFDSKHRVHALQTWSAGSQGGRKMR